MLWSPSVAAEVAVFFFVGRPLLDRLGPTRAAMLAAGAGIVRWLLAECVPEHLAATKLTVYGTVGIGAPTALLILASGQLYQNFGARGIWVMAALCAAALPLAARLRDPAN